MCASRLLRRSGNAVASICLAIDWHPTVCVQVGVGGNHQEVDVIREAWPDTKFIGMDPLPVKDYPGVFSQTAVSDFVGEAVLNVKRRHADGSTLGTLEDRQVRRRDKVRVVTLDSVIGPEIKLQTRADRVLLWLDCEGSELAALRGAALCEGEKFIDCVSMVNVELTAKPGTSNWVSPTVIYDWLAAHGFFMLWVHTMKIPDGQWDCLAVRRHLFRPDYCCFPMEVERFNASSPV